jgi:hypothetical protein
LQNAVNTGVHSGTGAIPDGEKINEYSSTGVLVEVQEESGGINELKEHLYCEYSTS